MNDAGIFAIGMVAGILLMVIAEGIGEYLRYRKRIKNARLDD